MIKKRQDLPVAEKHMKLMMKNRQDLPKEEKLMKKWNL